MKNLLIVAALLVSSTSFASGFVCSGQGYRVKMYNQVQPQLGTKNPAVLVVSHAQAGTLAVLSADEIVKTNKVHSVVYSGQTNARTNGHFVFVQLEVVKQPIREGESMGQHVARFAMNADGRSVAATMVCQPYLKN